MLELDLPLAPVEVLAVDGCLVDCPPLDLHVPVRPVLSDDRQLGITDALLDQVTSLLKLESSGL